MLGFLEEFCEQNGVEMPPHPPYSLDLNAVENIWKMLKYKIAELYPAIKLMPTNESSRLALVRAAIDVLENHLPEDIWERLAMSMTRRLLVVIDAKCWYTKY